MTSAKNAENDGLLSGMTIIAGSTEYLRHFSFELFPSNISTYRASSTPVGSEEENPGKLLVTKFMNREWMTLLIIF